MSLKETLEQSSFGISVGTGLALETLFSPVEPSVDPDREVDKIDLSVYNLYIFNVSTILRNIVSSLNAEQFASANANEIYKLLLDEIDTIQGLFTTAGVDVSFYVNTYSYFKNAYEKTMRKPTSDKQIRLNTINEYCLKKIGSDRPIRNFYKDVNYGKDSNALMFSHIPADLLGYKNFGRLDLLESHTGKIKTRKDWNSKYFPVPNCDMSILPLMEYFLVKFGDKIMFAPAPLKERQELYKTLKAKNITPLTDYGITDLFK